VKIVFFDEGFRMKIIRSLEYLLKNESRDTGSGKSRG
jgi:hypothetical protein